MGSTSGAGNNANIPPEEDNMNDATMEVILEFQAVTGMEDMDESRRILDRNNWDLLAAISNHMGFEAPGPSSASTSRQNQQPDDAPSSADSSPRPDYSVNRYNTNRAPTPSRPGGSQGLFGWIWTIISRPMDFVFRFLWDFIGIGLRFIRADPRRALTNPVQDVIDFIQEYEAKYGNDHPVFYQGTYSQALSDAKKELKFLLVYLHSEDHADTNRFCRNVMINTDFKDLVRENMLFWACSVSKPEGYRTSQALRENTYPFLALIVLKSNRMTIVKKIEGIVEPERVLSLIHQGVADNEAFLVVARQDRLERNMTQTLRQQQDEAYLESLRADQEKEKRKQEETERKRQLELEKQRLIDEEKQRIEDIKQQKITAAQTLKPEPPVDHPDVIRTIVKLPCGTRLERRFLKNDSLQHLYQFVFSHDIAPNEFDVATNFPKRNLPCKVSKDNPEPPTFTQAGLGKNEMLFVYDLES